MQDEPRPSTEYPGYYEHREGDYRILSMRSPRGFKVTVRLYDPLPWDEADKLLDKRPEKS